MVSPNAYKTLPPQAKQQVAVAAALQRQQQQALAVQRAQAMQGGRAGQNPNLLTGLGNAWQQVGNAGPVAPFAAIPLAMMTPMLAVAGVLQAVGG